MEDNEMLASEFKQAGTEYSFFQDMALKYLAFYTATLGLVTTAIVTISDAEFKSAGKTTVEFLQGPFLTMCGLFLLFIGTAVALILLRCRDKAIISVKAMMCVRRSANQAAGCSLSGDSCYHAYAIPRHYKFLSPTQGIILIIAAANSVILLSVFGFGKTGMDAIVELFRLGNSTRVAFFLIFCLTALQYLLVFNYMINKDKVDVRLRFNPGQAVRQIKIEYLIPRCVTNASTSHCFTRLMFYLIGLTEKKITFLKKKIPRAFSVVNNELQLKLIAGHYRIIAAGWGWEDLLIFGNIYEEFEQEVVFRHTDDKAYEKAGDRQPRRFPLVSKWDPGFKKAVNMTVRFTVYALLIALPRRWDVFTGSWAYRIAVWAFAGHVFLEFARNFWKTRSRIRAAFNIKRLVEFLVKRSRREHSVGARILATLFGASLFGAGIPAVVYWCGQRAPGTSPIPADIARWTAWVFFALGAPWVLSSVIWQMVRGKGTPVPLVPTTNFLATGPYRFVRNPMMLGFFLYLLGWTFFWNKPGCLWATLGLIAILTLEIKLIEEPELEKRFGQAYRQYKGRTRFILPDFRQNRPADENRDDCVSPKR